MAAGWFPLAAFSFFPCCLGCWFASSAPSHLAGSVDLPVGLLVPAALVAGLPLRFLPTWLVPWTYLLGFLCLLPWLLCLLSPQPFLSFSVFFARYFWKSKGGAARAIVMKGAYKYEHQSPSFIPVGRENLTASRTVVTDFCCLELRSVNGNKEGRCVGRGSGKNQIQDGGKVFNFGKSDGEPIGRDRRDDKEAHGDAIQSPTGIFDC
ncbi:hypothetical protein IEQ34_003597 [Dendrobium chrysotoxum]|uniref:Uncharacterized protein n=1 Tax=Dendrobium chrysotoxum TaxID=161865 RepID=A0AAV7HK23_DENCH|nr:hypothetical protein IEQ34_003597 [Dendrobium chrysotoxum]